MAPEKKKVLVIDEDENILNWFRVLQRSDHSCEYHFLLAPGDLTSVVKELKPDLVFLDHHDGKKLTEIIRIAAGDKVTVVQISTDDLSHDGGSFMRKPLERKAVETKIRALLKI